MSQDSETHATLNLGTDNRQQAVKWFKIVSNSDFGCKIIRADVIKN